MNPIPKNVKNRTPFSGKKFEKALEIRVSGVPYQKLSPERRKRWKPILQVFGYGYVDPFIIFLAETLEIVSGIEVKFSGTYENKGFGTSEEYWTLKGGEMEIFRAWKSELSESMQRVEVEDNRTVISGFSPNRGLKWNGNYDGIIGMKLQLWGISNDEAKRLRKIARELFEMVEIHR